MGDGWCVGACCAGTFVVVLVGDCDDDFDLCPKILIQIIMK